MSGNRGPAGLVLLGSAVFFCTPVGASVQGGVLDGLRVWSGVVRVDEDVLVPVGATLVVEAGTRVVFAPAVSTKTDPAFWHPDTELAVSGRLEVRGTSEAPVVFEGEGAWGGLVAAPGARVELTEARIVGAAEGLLCVGAKCVVSQSRIERCDYGIVLGPEARMEADEVRAVTCRVGVLDARGGSPGPLPVRIEGAEDAERLTVPLPSRSVAPLAGSPAALSRVEYVGEYTVTADEAWRGQVVVTGRVTVVPGAVLTLEPGTRVAFRKVDTNRDGLGEGELLVLGGIRSRGTPDAPVWFESAEPDPRPGDWDKVSLIASEDPDNCFEYSVFRAGTQALHAHFSRMSVSRCYFEGNVRALQFQESEETRVEHSVFADNKQGLRCRDSRVWISGSLFLGNLYGVHAFRADLEFVGNTVEGCALGSVLAKESRVRFESNRISGNRDGLRMKDPGSWALLRANLFWEAGEDALSLSGVAGRVEGNSFRGSGLDLVGVETSDVVFRENRFGPSGRHAVHLRGGTPVDAAENFWEGEPIPSRIHDREDDASLGTVRWRPPLPAPPTLALPDPAW